MALIQQSSLIPPTVKPGKGGGTVVQQQQAPPTVKPGKGVDRRRQCLLHCCYLICKAPAGRWRSRRRQGALAKSGGNSYGQPL